jgi:hypothetical protein
MIATIGRYMNHTRLDAPKCSRKSSFCDENSCFIVILSSHKNQSIIRDLKMVELIIRIAKKLLKSTKNVPAN